jgi:hypothetical protein
MQVEERVISSCEIEGGALLLTTIQFMTPPPMDDHGLIVQRVAEQYGISLDDPELESKVQTHLDEEFDKWLDDHEDEAIENGKKYTKHLKTLADHIEIEVKKEPGRQRGAR